MTRNRPHGRVRFLSGGRNGVPAANAKANRKAPKPAAWAHQERYDDGIEHPVTVRRTDQEEST